MNKYNIKFRNNVDYNILNGREIIYLDSNAWIDLADEKTQTAKILKELLLILVKDHKIFCPLNFPTLSELYNQSYTSMLRVGELMNSLSLNFSFSFSKDIWSHEVVKFVFSYLNNVEYTLSNQVLFVPFIGYLSSNASLTFPEDSDTEKEMVLYKILKNKISKMTLSEFIKLSNGLENRHQKNLANKIQNDWNDRWDRNNGDRKKIRIEIENIIANEVLLPLLRNINTNLTKDQLLQITNYIASFPKDNKGRAFNSIIKNMPSLKNEVEIWSAAQLDRNRKITMNDFFDLENIPIPLAYSNYFLARDKWVRHLLKITNLPRQNNCHYFFDPNELLNSLTAKYLK